MKFWFDTEFIEDGKTIDLISIGIVAEDGRTFYAEPLECEYDRASDWVKANVLPQLRGGNWMRPRGAIAADIVACRFLADEADQLRQSRDAANVDHARQ